MIEIRRKPDNVSWDEIHLVIYRAHASNREKGVDIRNAHLSGEELKDSLGSDGVCFVALDGKKVVATSSVAFHTLNTWYARGKVAYGTLSAVLPEYKGRHLFSILEKTRIEYIRKIGCTGVYSKIAEGNIKRRSIAKKDGYYEVAIGHTSYNSHNYVMVFKWLEKRPFPVIYIRARYAYSYVWLKFNMLLGRI